MSERREALWRIPILIIAGIIMEVWGALIWVVTIFHWFYALIFNKRSKDLATFCNHFNTQFYRLIRYATLTTNDRPWPFSDLGKNLHAVDMKKKKN